MFSVILSLFACSRKKSLEEEEPASRMPYCEEVETAFELSEVSPMGISIAGFTDQLAESYTVITQGDEPECLLASLSLDSRSVRYVGQIWSPQKAMAPFQPSPLSATITWPSTHRFPFPVTVAFQSSTTLSCRSASCKWQQMVRLIASFRSDIDSPQEPVSRWSGRCHVQHLWRGRQIGFSGRIDALVVEESGSTVLAMHEAPQLGHSGRR